MTTQDDYQALFPTIGAAIAFEHTVLSAGREFLPACAIAVLDGSEDADTNGYWAWLISQAQEGVCE